MNTHKIETSFYSVSQSFASRGQGDLQLYPRRVTQQEAMAFVDLPEGVVKCPTVAGVLQDIDRGLKYWSDASGMGGVLPLIKTASIKDVAYFVVKDDKGSPLARLLVAGARLTGMDRDNGWRPAQPEDRENITEDDWANNEGRGIFEIAVVQRKGLFETSRPEFSPIALQAHDRVVRLDDARMTVIDPKAEFEARARVHAGPALRP